MFAGAFFENWLPVGMPGQLVSAGTIPLDNAAVGLAVAGGFCFMLIEFLQQTLVRRRDRGILEGAPMSFLPYAVAAWIVVIGLYGIVTSRDLIHLVISLAGDAVGVLHRAARHRLQERRLGADLRRRPPTTPAVDPVVQALTLTDVVVGTTVTALLLARSPCRPTSATARLDPRELRPARNP